MGTSLYPMLTYGKLARSFELRPEVGEKRRQRTAAHLAAACAAQSQLSTSLAPGGRRVLVG